MDDIYEFVKNFSMRVDEVEEVSDAGTPGRERGPISPPHRDWGLPAVPWAWPEWRCPPGGGSRGGTRG